MSDLSAVLEHWEPVIGLEVHAQLSTRTKMFCGCRNSYGAPPNSYTCPTCLGLPGALPVANEQAVNFALRLGLALGCEITQLSRFARKNYFYPDLTKGYQISQYDDPLCVGGQVTIRWGNEVKDIALTRIHMEEDAGKSIHAENGDGTKVDFNRCGVPLVEIVSEPVIQSPEEAKVYLVRLKQILEYLNICDCNMEEGNLRCDANISVRPLGESKFGVKTEMKNMNSFRGVERGLTSEIVRQAQVLDEGGEVEQVTLLWNEAEQKAEVMRSKEEAHDYRYFPDPDLVPLSVSDDSLHSIRSSLVEMPYEREERFVNQYGLRLEDTLVLTSEKSLADYFEDVVRAYSQPKSIFNWMMGELAHHLKRDHRSIVDCTVKSQSLAGLIRLIDEGKVSGKMAKKIFEKMYRSGKDPDVIVGEEELIQMSDTEELEIIVDQVLESHPEKVSAYRDGKLGLLGFFMGQVMRKTNGQANPNIVDEILHSKLL